jgi:hypothetical protein
MNRTRSVIGVLVALAITQFAHTTTTQRWVVDTAQELLEGRGENVEVTSEGLLRMVAGWTAGPSFDEPVVMAAAPTADGALIVGTGHPARLYEVRGGSLRLLAEVPAEQITALLVEPDGGVLVAAVAPGVLYRWDGVTLDSVGHVNDGGIWDLEYFGERVVAAGGPPATVYRLDDHGLVRWVELPDVHASCLEAHGDRLLVGTSDKGLILSIDQEGRVGVVADSSFTEISDIAVGDGVVWATALVGEPVTKTKISKTNGAVADNSEVSTEVTVTTELELPTVNGKTATSEVIRLTPEGGLLSIHRFHKEVASAIAWDGEGMLVGTGYEGEVWRFVEDGGARLATVDAVQVVGIVNGGDALLTQGPGRVFWRSRKDDVTGRFRSPAQQFNQPVRFGEYRIDPPADSLRIRFRSGVSAKPDDTWLEWTDWMAAPHGRVSLPPASSLQWELEISAVDGGSSTVDRVEVAVVEVNLPPRISEFKVEEPGVVYLAAPPSAGPVIEAVHPDLNGIFTVIDEATRKKSNSTKGKKYYRAGFRTVSWKAADTNKDPLRFRLELENRTGFSFEVRDRITGTQLGVDTSAMPDGVYRFRLTASDAPRNPASALATNRASRWFVVDNTPPVISIDRSGETWVATVSDALSPIVRAEWSRDGESWQALAPADGLLDGRDESFAFPVASGRHMVVVRVVDRQHNRSTAGAEER